MKAERCHCSGRKISGAHISIQLLMDPSKGAALRQALDRLAAVLDETSEDGLL
ncbi:MAG: hypothetical protein ACK546_01090 [bacterium]